MKSMLKAVVGVCAAAAGMYSIMWTGEREQGLLLLLIAELYMLHADLVRWHKEE